MAAWRRAIELSLGDEDTAKLRLIAQSRTEPASRVERARILLAYREDPSFFAVSRALGLHHQTVQRCVERAVVEGWMAALDDRPRPGRGEGDRRAPQSGLRPRRVRRSVGPSDDAARAPGPPQKTTGLPDRPAISAPARPGLPARFAIARSISTGPYPFSERQFNRPPPRCHDLPPRSILGSRGLYRNPNSRDESPEMTTFMESIV